MASPENLDAAGQRRADSFRLSAPQISLPKGGGAIRGLGEKFAANPVTGTGSMTVPIAASAGRAGFGPGLTLSYDSGAGNGPFGFGWTLSLPAISRKTEKGLPRYEDVNESDVFILCGAEDLVPEFRRDPTRDPPDNWVEVDGAPVVYEDVRQVGGASYRVRRYRPRIEGLFARIERWTNVDDPGDCFWRSISQDNVTTWYGRRGDSRIADPADDSCIFSWLICESYDDKGNVVEYEYLPEDTRDVDFTRASERNRSRSANSYLKFIRYGNHVPYLPTLGRGPWPAPPDDAWYFEMVFDYGEHDAEDPLPDDGDTNDWKRRNDPFSSYRSGFEVRTYRLCQRVLMFHHFEDAPDVGRNYLVRSTDFTYSYEEDPANARNPVYSFLRAVTNFGYERDGAPGGQPYRKRALPPLQFEYTRPDVDETVLELTGESLRNVPYGLDGAAYQWVDLDGEGITGVLTEQAEGWFYKRNLSPANVVAQTDGSVRTEAALAPLELIAARPNAALAPGGAQFMDLAGDGQPDLVLLDAPVRGFYEHEEGAGWKSFRAFPARLNRDLHDPNLRLVDLDGDGHADVLITEDDALAWHPSLGEEGFGPVRRLSRPRDEERGPALVFADGTQSIYLADMSGDGLTDLARIRNGEICYWPNLGYGSFGPKVTMDGAPWFDAPDQFDQRRVRLADIDGTGTTDIIYLHGDGPRLYFNQSGNGWSQPQTLATFPRIDNVGDVSVLDLLGIGTACLVWSSPLPGDAGRVMRYIDLMGGHKPHLLVKARNNLGATTEVEYAPSTRFYLQDKLNGTPWTTRLPFPVHVVERVSVSDKWRGTTFTTRYSYHHGYFDGIEREFRGFGRVEQTDVEDYGTFAAGNAASPYVTADQRLFQPPVKTITWFHTGAFSEAAPGLLPFRDEFFPVWFAASRPGAAGGPGGFEESSLPDPDFADADLTTDEWRQALRACKGLPLRQEIYELDVDALRAGAEQRVKLFSASCRNCHIDRLQPQAFNRHAVFLVTESEALTYHYELDLRASPPRPDPRVAHTVNLRIDEFGRVLESVAIGYPRLSTALDVTLPVAARQLAADVQAELHIAYVESAFTAELPETQFPDAHRLGLPCETRSYEVTGLESRLGAGGYFALDDLRAASLHNAASLEYHQQPDPAGPARPVQKRIVEHVRSLYFDDASDTGAPTAALRFGEHGPRGLKYEDYKLALTENLLAAVFRVPGAAGAVVDRLSDEVAAGTDVRALLDDPARSGYVDGATIDVALAAQYWMRSGAAGFDADAAQHFFLPRRYTDPFGNITEVAFDARDLLIESSTDTRGNVTRVRDFDGRVLAPRALEDANGNVTRVAFDVFGLPCAVALEAAGDSVGGLNLALRDPPPQDLAHFLGREPHNPPTAYAESLPRRWLDAATTRFVYHFGEVIDGNVTTYERYPGAAVGISRETHVASLAGGQTKLQVEIEYSDGGGDVLVRKAQAEPDPASNAPSRPLRWIKSGKTVLNNKGKAVKQYEPDFSAFEHRFDPGEAAADIGVTPVIYYDAPGRVIRTELPDGSYSRVEFSPWHVATFDANDTIGERANAWYARNSGATASADERRAAHLALGHRDTPVRIVLDSLGRDVIGIAHNRLPDANGPVTIDGAKYREEFNLTFTKFDAEGKPLWIRDARGNLVMQYVTPLKATRFADEPNEDVPVGVVPCYDVAGNLLYQHSMDAGDRWTLMDAAGKPMVAWDRNDRGPNTATHERLFYTQYDELHRPVSQELIIDQGAAVLLEAFEYCDTAQPNGAVNLADARARNLIGQAVRHWDSSGLRTLERVDVSGAPAHVTRALVVATSVSPQSIVDWNITNREDRLEGEVFHQITDYDALGRVTRLYNWHRDITFGPNGDTDSPGATNRVAVYEPAYNERGALLSERVHLRAAKATGADGRVSFTANPRYSGAAIGEITYDVKGQRLTLELGNGTQTRYTYDPLTFRLTHLVTRRRGAVAAGDCTSNTANAPRPSRPCGVQNLHYIYDPVGNITHIQDDAQQTIYFHNAAVEPSNDYTYDALYRLIEATGREHAAVPTPPRMREGPWPEVTFPSPHALRNYRQTYAYDAVGNFVDMVHVAGAGSWTRHYENEPDSNRLRHTWYGNNMLAAVRYRHDAHGNMLNLNRRETPPPRDPADDWGLDLRWDWRDMIAGLDLGGGSVARYHYGADKQRVRKIIQKQGFIEDRIYLGGYELYRRYRTSKPDDPVEEIESLHLMDGDQRLLLIDDVIKTDRRHANGAPYRTAPIYRYQYSNHLGSACLELADDAQIISCEEYHPYGTSAYRAMKSNVEAPPKRYRFTGMERDEENGLGYHSARYFAPSLGTWTSCDPKGIEAGLHRYAFVRNCPTKFRDQTGTVEQMELVESIEIPTVALRNEFAHYDTIGQYCAAETHSWGLNPDDYVLGHSADTPHFSSPAGKPQIISPQTKTSNALQSVQERAAAQAVRARNDALRAQGKEGPLEFVRERRVDVTAEKNMQHDVELPQEVKDMVKNPDPKKNYNAAKAEQVKADYLARNDATIESMKSKSAASTTASEPAPMPSEPPPPTSSEPGSSSLTSQSAVSEAASNKPVLQPNPSEASAVGALEGKVKINPGGKAVKLAANVAPAVLTAYGTYLYLGNEQHAAEIMNKGPESLTAKDYLFMDSFGYTFKGIDAASMKGKWEPTIGHKLEDRFWGVLNWADVVMRTRPIPLLSSPSPGGMI